MLLLQDIHSSMWMKCFKTSKTKCVMLKGTELTQLISVHIDSDWCTVSVFLCRPDTNTFLVVQESHLHAGECCAQYHSDGHMHCFGMQSMLHKAMTSGAHASGACPLSRTTAMPLKQTHSLVAPNPLQMNACAANAICVLD